MGMPVRSGHGPLHLGKPTGRGYRTACKRTLTGGALYVPPRLSWRRCWRLELVCSRCERLRAQARNDAHLALLAGW